MNQNQRSYIDLAELLSQLLKRMGIIILCGVMCGLAGFGYSKFLITPLYSANALMIVNSSDKYVNSETYVP